MTDLVLLIGNPRLGSRTRTLAETVARALTAALERTGTSLRGSQVLELGEIVGVSFGPGPAHGGGSVADPFAVVRDARLLVVATPTYKGTYTGLLKIFLDQYGAGALAGTVAVPVAIAASPAHRESVAVALTALLAELGAGVAAPAVALLEPEIAAADRLATEWAARHGAAIAEALAAHSDGAPVPLLPHGGP
ncbi:MAG: reductase [Micromonosporaceae bacterium]